MNNYLVVVHDSERAPVDFSLLRGDAPSSHSFSPMMDTWLFVSSLGLSEVESRFATLLPNQDDGEQHPWVLVQVAGCSFGGSHSPGPSSRLSSFFES